MLVKTTRFGEIEVEGEKIITFRDGMVGFPRLKKYFLVESSQMPLIYWLQSAEDAQIAFPLIEPWFFRRDFKPKMNEAEKISNDLSESDTTKILVVLTIPEDMARMTVNLKAPIIFNVNKSLAAQLVLQEKHYEVRCPAHEGFSKALSNFNVSQSAPEFTEEWRSIKVPVAGEQATTGV